VEPTVNMKKWLAGTVPVVATGALVGIITRPSEAAVTPVAGGVYTIASGASGKCLDVASAGTANGGLLVQVACTAAASDQQFAATSQNSAFGLVNGNSGKCVDVPYSATTAGTQLWQWTCGASVNQTWSFTASAAASGKFLIKSVLSGLRVSNKDGSTAGNNPIVQEACSDISRMQWSFTQVGGATSPTTGPTTSPPAGRWSNKADGFASTAGGTTGGAGGTTVTVTTYADDKDYDYDGIQMDTADHIWIDHTGSRTSTTATSTPARTRRT
jgi:ricin-type beta-trefoil lectin protein